MFKQQHVLPLSLIQLFSGVNLWLARLRGGEGGDLQHYLEIEISSSRAECGFTRGQCHSDLNANCEGDVSSNLKRAKKRRRARPARIPEMCGEERGAAIKSRAPIYGGISRLSEGRERVEIELVPSFLHSVLTSLFLGVAHISRNDRIIFQSSAAVRLECPTGQRAFVPRGI